MNKLTYQFLRELYTKNRNALDSYDDECQFLQFQSKFKSLREFFENVDDVKSFLGENELSWYVGFSNCQPKILYELRKLYAKPHFLPDNSEIPSTDYIFLGHDEGAVMHVSTQIYK